MLENGSYRITIQVTLGDFKRSVGRHLVTGQDVLVHELHERRITDPRILDRLAKTHHMRVKMRLVSGGNALWLPGVGHARLIPPLPPGCGATELGEHPSDCSSIAAYRQGPNPRHILRRGLRLDGARQRLLHRHRGMTATLPMHHAGEVRRVIVEAHHDLPDQETDDFLCEGHRTVAAAPQRATMTAQGHAHLSIRLGPGGDGLLQGVPLLLELREFLSLCMPPALELAGDHTMLRGRLIVLCKGPSRFVLDWLQRRVEVRRV
jgi:hypothetical protein